MYDAFALELQQMMHSHSDSESISSVSRRKMLKMLAVGGAFMINLGRSRVLLQTLANIHRGPLIWSADL